MVEYQDDGQALIIAGNLPGLNGYFDTYPDVEGEDKQEEHEFAQNLLERAKTHLADYDLNESTSKSNSGNRSMEDLYVTVDKEERDRVVFKMWQMLNDMKKQYLDFLKNTDVEEHFEYLSLKSEVVAIFQDINLGGS